MRCINLQGTYESIGLYYIYACFGQLFFNIILNYLQSYEKSSIHSASAGWIVY